MSVTFPKGFRANGVTAGLKPSGRPDLALLVADNAASVSGLLTDSLYPAAPVTLTLERLARGTTRGVLVNSGDANAGRGEAGVLDALTTTAAAAAGVGVDHEEILACSTGVIGGGFGADKIVEAMPALVHGLTEGGGTRFANAICTTDTVVKEAAAEVGRFRIGACAKGAAMVEPRLNLATMLVFFTTDAPMDTPALRMLAKTALQPAFHQLTIDGCTSTNDTVLLLASGAAGGERVRTGDDDWSDLAKVMRELADSLAYQMAADAEGGTKVLLVDVVRAKSEAEARSIAKAIANSLLVKTAIFGSDPNPGRLVQAVGASKAEFDPTRTRIWLGDVLVSDAGVVPADYNREAAHAAVTEHDVYVRVDLGFGPGSARAIGCDLSYDYVKINAEYTT